MNILFIMCDQLRADYLSCYGHPHLNTRNIDMLASRGVRFNNAYCQAPLCGPSRASFYTGRYMSSHGVMGNGDPLKMGELTLGDYLRSMGMIAVVVGKSEGSPNFAALDKFDIDLKSTEGQCLANNGFLPFEAYSGLYPTRCCPTSLVMMLTYDPMGSVVLIHGKDGSIAPLIQTVKELAVGTCGMLVWQHVYQKSIQKLPLSQNERLSF